MIAGRHPTQQDKIPLLLPELEIAVQGYHPAQFEPQLRGSLLSKGHSFVGGIKPSDLPSEFRQVERVAALSHPHIQGMAVMPPLDNGCQEGIRRIVERRLGPDGNFIIK